MSHGNTPRWRIHDGSQDAPQALAEAVANQLLAALTQRGRALLAVSGGKSPLALFQQLSQQPLDWSQVTVLLVDERCVPPQHPDSNSALVQQHLLVHAAAKARWLPFFDQLPPPFESASPNDEDLSRLTVQAEARLASLHWPLDVAVLGMGEDGHTASLFPDAPGLDRALAGPQRVAWTRPLTAPHPRLTLTLPTLLAARALFLPLQGAAKRAVFEQACLAPTPELPVSLLLHHSAHPVQVWLTP